MIYETLFSDPLSLLTYIFLLFSIVSFWVKRDFRVWGVLFLISLVFGLVSGRVLFLGLLPLSVLSLALISKDETQDSPFDFYSIYSICKLQVLYYVVLEYPEAGEYAPCIQIIYKKKIQIK